MTTNQILSLLNKVRKTTDNQYIALCPAHNDKEPSLSIKELPDRTLLYCQAGCKTKAILEALKLDWKDLYFQSASYQYTHNIFKKKTILPDGSKTFIWENTDEPDKKKPVFKKDEPKPVYLLSHPENVQQNMPKDAPPINKFNTLFLTEGEKDAVTLHQLGLNTASLYSSGQLKHSDIEPFLNKNIVIIPDNDTPGKEYLQKILHTFNVTRHANPDIFNQIAFFMWPKNTPEKDITELFESDRLSIEFITGNLGYLEKPAKQDESDDTTYNPEDIIDESFSTPPIDQNAFDNPLGETILDILPFTEASQDAIYTQILTIISNAISDRISFLPSNIFAIPPTLYIIIAGPTFFGRKGTSLAISKALTLNMSGQPNSMSSISSGEGLIFQLKAFPELINNNQTTIHRCILYLEEFERFFKVVYREHNPLSDIIRQLYDAPLAISIPTRNNPISVERPRLSIIGHITPKTLRKYMSIEEMEGGLLNRFLFTYSIRSKKQAEPLSLNQINIISSTLTKIVNNITPSLIQTPKEITLKMKEIEETTAQDNPIFARSISIAHRIATILAAIEKQKEISTKNLDQALTIVKHSTQFLKNFLKLSPQESIVQSDILNFLLNSPNKKLSITQLCNLQGNNVSAYERNKEITKLINIGRITIEKVKPSGNRKKPMTIIKLVD